MTVSPMQKVYAVFSKNYTEEKYSVLEKLDKEIVLEVRSFSKEIECMLKRESLCSDRNLYAKKEQIDPGIYLL